MHYVCNNIKPIIDEICFSGLGPSGYTHEVILVQSLNLVLCLVCIYVGMWC